MCMHACTVGSHSIHLKERRLGLFVPFLGEESVLWQVMDIGTNADRDAGCVIRQTKTQNEK